MRLKSGFWVRATLRRCAAMGLMAVVARKGDEDAGAVLVKHRLGPDRFTVLTQVRDTEELVWLPTTGKDPVTEARADQVIVRAVDVDEDLWVIEIEGEGTVDQPMLLERILSGS